MRSARRFASATGLGFLSVVACEQSSIRDCPLDPGSTANQFQLDYELIAPHECPVPIFAKAERKRAAGVVYDDGQQNFEFEGLSVKNSQNVEVQNSLRPFQLIGGRRQAQPDVNYPAATGVIGLSDGTALPDPVPSTATDYGLFRAYYTSNPFDGYGVTGTLTITYEKGYLAMSTVGTEIPRQNTAQSWTATGSGGTTPYSYKWYREGQLVSQSSSYSTTVGTTDFGLRVEAIDAQMKYGRKDMWIDVDGIRASLSGPSTVYLSQGGGTWSATAQGGASAYTYKWYVYESNGANRRFVGSGSSWTGYPGEGRNYVQVIVSNAAGASHLTEKFVTGIGDPNGGCVPEPPAVTCDP